MADRTNKFLTHYKQRNKTATDDFVEQLYEEPEITETEAEKTVETVTENIMPEPVVESYVSAPAPEIPANPPVKEKKKVGRPRKSDEERSIFNIKLSVSEKELLTVASAARGKSRVDYIVDLIKADYDKNKDYYDTVRRNIFND
ncbi:hypothetical protein [Butyrivibrio sp. JL13D10]|uniref:hypothetical protein n=1 Tax=Butyrivibrio sp. JL13D10 TaxID=3236815 RepID=UPI0038B5F834